MVPIPIKTESAVSEFDIVSIGECMVEFYSDKPFIDAQSFHKSFGGGTLSVLVTASRLGSRSGYISRIGEDDFAPYLLQEMLNEKIDLSLVKVTPGRKNGMFVISTFEGGGVNLAVYRDDTAAALLSVNDLETGYLSAAKFLHVSGVSQAVSKSCRNAVFEACRLVKENNTGAVSYDSHYRSNIWSAKEAKRAFEEVLPFIDILFLSHPLESKTLIGTDEPKELFKVLWQQGIRVLILSLGKQGCIVGERHSGAIGNVAAKIISNGNAAWGIASEDAFTGAFLHGLARGFDVFQAARLGNIASSLVRVGHGTVAALPRHGDVYRLFEAA